MVGVFKCVFLCVCIKSWLSRKVLIDLLIYLQKKKLWNAYSGPRTLLMLYQWMTPWLAILFLLVLKHCLVYWMKLDITITEYKNFLLRSLQYN